MRPSKKILRMRKSASVAREGSRPTGDGAPPVTPRPARPRPPRDRSPRTRNGTLRTLVMRLPIDPDLAPPAARERERARARGRGAVGLVAIGGVAGALARAGIERADAAGHVMPWPTLAINISGSFALALLLVVLEERLVSASWPRPLIGVGVLGGYTTFSTFSTQTVLLLHAGRAALALTYVLLSVTGALAAAIVGVALGRAAMRLSAPAAWRRRVQHAMFVEAAEEEG